MQRILVHFMVIIVVAALYLAYDGAQGVTARNVAVAMPLALLFAALVWLRWDMVPKMRRERLERRSRQDSGADVG